MRRGKLGFREVERRLERDVNLRAIPALPRGFDVVGPDKISYGGDAPKSFIDFPYGEVLYAHAYFAKASRKQGPRECVTEALISAIGSGLPVRIAKFRLAIVPGTAFGDPDVRFMSRFFLDTTKREILTHGIELFAIAFGMEEKAVRREIPRSAESDFYTVDLVEEVLRQTGRTGDEQSDLLDGLGRMLGFDAIVGANDRHPRNWGIIQSAIDPNAPYRFAPIFDTARGVFWNFSDEQLLKKARDQGRQTFLEKYANESTPLIGVPGTGACNHFDLVRHMLSSDRERPVARAVRKVINAFSMSRCEDTLHDRFGRLLSRYRLELIRDLLTFRNTKLKEICHTSR
jgi:HipA-like C-terminal domain